MTHAQLMKKLKHLKCSWALQGSASTMPTESDWSFITQIPTMGSRMEQERVNMEHMVMAFTKHPNYVMFRTLKQNIYMRK